MLNETFTVDAGELVRSVVPRRGKPYEHRCALASFESVAHAVDEWVGEVGFTLEAIQSATDLPFTQVAVALAFLKERGIVSPVHGRKHIAANPGGTHLDALTEYHALREGAPIE